MQWMGDDEDLDASAREPNRGVSTQTAVVNGWGKASSAYEEKQQFVFDRIDGWWRGARPDDAARPFGGPAGEVETPSAIRRAG